MTEPQRRFGGGGERDARHLTALEEQLGAARTRLAQVSAQNDRLATTLREARDQIVALKSEVDRLGQPPAQYATFLEAKEDGTADIVSAGRRMRVAVSPGLDLAALRPGQDVMVNEAMNVVAAFDYERTGELASVKEVLPDGRVLVLARADEERVVRLAGPLLDGPLRVGDSLTVDTRSGFAFERIPKAEVEELVLEEVPDIDYEDIGGLGPQIEAIRDAVELPFLHADLFREHGLRPPEGDPALRPPRLREDAHRQGGGQLAGQEGRGAARGDPGQELLPQHQGPRAAEQVRRGDRAPHPARSSPAPGRRRAPGRRWSCSSTRWSRCSAPAGRACPPTWRRRSSRSC